MYFKWSFANWRSFCRGLHVIMQSIAAKLFDAYMYTYKALEIRKKVSPKVTIQLVKDITKQILGGPSRHM